MIEKNGWDKPNALDWDEGLNLDDGEKVDLLLVMDLTQKVVCHQLLLEEASTALRRAYRTQICFLKDKATMDLVPMDLVPVLKSFPPLIKRDIRDEIIVLQFEKDLIALVDRTHFRLGCSSNWRMPQIIKHEDEKARLFLEKQQMLYFPRPLEDWPYSFIFHRNENG